MTIRWWRGPAGFPATGAGGRSAGYASPGQCRGGRGRQGAGARVRAGRASLREPMMEPSRWGGEAAEPGTGRMTPSRPLRQPCRECARGGVPTLGSARQSWRSLVRSHASCSSMSEPSRARSARWRRPVRRVAAGPASTCGRTGRPRSCSAVPAGLFRTARRSTRRRCRGGCLRHAPPGPAVRGSAIGTPARCGSAPASGAAR